MRALVVLALALLSGCGGKVFYVDSRFTAEEQQQIQAAADQWVVAGAEPIDFVWRQHVGVVSETENRVLRLHDRESQTIADFSDPSRVAVTHHRPLSDTVVLNVERIYALDPAHFQRYAAHEFGHVHGLGHTKNPGTLMFEAADSDELTPEDLHLLVLSRQP